MIIVLEGLDNCGKTTLSSMIVEYFKRKGIEMETSKEFNTEVGKLIKQLSIENKLDPYLKAYLFAADRQMRMKNYTNEELQQKVLIFDRYYYSAMAYRIAEGLDKDWVKTINNIFPKPSIGFYIDITASESIRRNTPTKFNILYKEEFLNNVRNAYLSFIGEESLIYVDGMQSIECIFEYIVFQIESLL